MLKKIITIVTCIVVFLHLNLAFSMEEINDFARHYQLLARNLHESYKGEGYFKLYLDMLEQLKGLEPHAHLEALTHMINEVVDKNRSLTKRFCKAIIDLYNNKMHEHHQKESAYRHIVEKVLILKGTYKYSVFDTLEVACSNGFNRAFSSGEKEKEPARELVDRLCEEIMGWRDIICMGEFELFNDIMNGLLQNISKGTLVDQYQLVKKAKEKLSNEPYIEALLQKYATSLHKMMVNDSNYTQLHQKQIFSTPDDFVLIGGKENGGIRRSPRMDLTESLKQAQETYFSQNLMESLKRSQRRQYCIIDASSVCKPLVVGQFLFFPLADGVHCYSLKTNKLMRRYMMERKNPLLISLKKYNIPGFVTEEIHGKKAIVSVYFNNEPDAPTQVLVNDSYCVRGYDNGSLEVNDFTKNEHFCFKIKHGNGIKALAFINDHKLISGAYGSMLRIWNLKKKSYNKSIECGGFVKDVSIFKAALLCLVGNSILMCDRRTDEVFPIHVDKDEIELFKSYKDGVVLGMHSGMLKYVKISAMTNKPKTIKVEITDPLKRLDYCGDMLIAQSANSCAVLRSSLI